MNFEDVIDHVIEGFRCGILDHLSIVKKVQGRQMISFYYGEIETGEYTAIWFEANGQCHNNYLDDAAKLAKTVGDATRTYKMAENEMQDILETVKRIEDGIARLVPQEDC